MAILVYTENREGKFKKATYELLSYASEMAKNYNSSVVALSIGDVAEDELKSLGQYGASKVIDVKNLPGFLDNKAYTDTIAAVAEKEGAKIIVMGHTLYGKALAPRLSAKLKAGLVSAAVAVPATYDPFVVKKAVFTGKAFANIKIATDIKILTLAQNSFGIAEPITQEPQIESYEATVEAGDKIKLVDTHKITGKILLTDAEIVVAGGRGMKSNENWPLLEELADVLNAGLACSRPVSDEGWRPHDEHVGQTGKIIAPTLYFAFGISGAIQHVGGVSASKCIVAVNKDPDAPIFEVADYGIVGDFKTVLPEITQAIKEVRK